MRRELVVFVAVAIAACVACEEQLTASEARLAVEELALTSEGSELVSVTVDLSTGFTIAEGVEMAAQALRDFAASQVPCSTVTLTAASVSIDFGALGDVCTYRGQTYAGKITWTVTSATLATVEIDHVWEGFRNSRASLTGSAHVTWDLVARTRHVEHTADWVIDGRALHATGDRTQSLLDEAAGVLGGLRLDGDRSWTSETGKWDLAIEDVQVLWDWPLPVAGRYVLTNPDGKHLTLAFEKLDAVTVRATLSGGRRTYVFNVSRFGAVTSG